MPAVLRLARLGCLGFLLAALAGCVLAAPMYEDIKELHDAMSSKDDPDPSRRELVHDYLPPERTPVPGVDIQPGQFMDSNGTVMDAAALGAEAAVFDYVLVGEGHTVACDHLVQASLLRALATAGKPPVVGLEMVSADRQGVLHGFNVGRYGPEALESGLDWEHTWGHPFSLYLPVFEAAWELKLPLEALNVPREVIRALGEGKVLTPEQTAKVPTVLIPAMPEQRNYLEEEFQRHQTMRAENATDEDPGPDAARDAARERAEALERFLLVQATWDTKMAEEAVHARRRHGGPVVVLAGAGHVEYGWGVGMRLGRLERGSHVLTVMPWRGGPVDRAQANYFFYCPMTHASRLGFTLQLNDQGALVTAVEPGSRTEAAGMAQGDVIVRAQGDPVTGMFDLHKAAIKARKADRDLVLTVRRGGPGGDAEVDVPIPLSGNENGDAGTP